MNWAAGLQVTEGQPLKLRLDRYRISSFILRGFQSRPRYIYMDIIPNANISGADIAPLKIDAYNNHNQKTRQQKE